MFYCPLVSFLIYQMNTVIILYKKWKLLLGGILLDKPMIKILQQALNISRVALSLYNEQNVFRVFDILIFQHF